MTEIHITPVPVGDPFEAALTRILPLGYKALILKLPVTGYVCHIVSKRGIVVTRTLPASLALAIENYDNGQLLKPFSVKLNLL